MAQARAPSLALTLSRRDASTVRLALIMEDVVVHFGAGCPRSASRCA